MEARIYLPIGMDGEKTLSSVDLREEKRKKYIHVQWQQLEFFIVLWHKEPSLSWNQTSTSEQHSVKGVQIAGAS